MFTVTKCFLFNRFIPMLLCLDPCLVNAVLIDTIAGFSGPHNLCFSVAVSSVWNSLHSGICTCYDTHYIIFLNRFQQDFSFP